jgi:hypothetical protein
MDEVLVRQDDDRIDLYYPPDWKSSVRTPAVVIVTGYPDPGFEKMFGCKFKDTGSSTSWGRLIAASGMIAIAYSNSEPEPDLHALLDHVSDRAEELGIDENRIGLWASSGNAALALSALNRTQCAALLYPVTLDLDGSNWVADLARQFRFANPYAGKSVADLPADVPLFLARAGRDEIPHLNDALDRFLAHAVARNLPVSFVNHAEGPHAFDLVHDSEMSREVVRWVLAFLKFHLG